MITSAAKQTEFFKNALDLLVAKIEEDERTIGPEFPYITDASGAWRTKPGSQTEGYTGEGSFGNWFCGFWIGMLLAAFLHSGRQHFLDVAISRMRSIVPHSDDRNTHDIGFNLCTSVPSAYHITGDPWLREVGVYGANQLRSRLVTTRDNAYIPSWPPVHDRGSRTVQIDTMPILPLLYWAADESKDVDLHAAGEAHARTTQQHFVRPDYSTVHAVEFDPISGCPTRKFTFRGYADHSCWSRGQAWAIYGFVATARATRRIEYLQLAERLTDHLLSRLDATLIPFWDLDDPSNPVHRAIPRRQLSSHRHCWTYLPCIMMPPPGPNGKGVVSLSCQALRTLSGKGGEAPRPAEARMLPQAEQRWVGLRVDVW